jgi:hypothetical protein
MVITRVGGPDIVALSKQALSEVTLNIGDSASNDEVAHLMASGFLQAAIMRAGQQHKKFSLPPSLSSLGKLERESRIRELLEQHHAQIAAVFMEIGVKSETSDGLAEFVTDQSIAY